LVILDEADAMTQDAQNALRRVIRMGLLVKLADIEDVSVGEVLEDPFGQWQRLDLLCRHRVARYGAAQVAQAWNRPGRPPEPHVAVSGPAGGARDFLG
ncbi:hypothetical protein XENOCAPTIV_004689, partial [Xenoophorus captivus]